MYGRPLSRQITGADKEARTKKQHAFHYLVSFHHRRLDVN